MAYGVLEIVDGNFFTETHIVDHNGKTMETLDVVRRLTELEEKLALRESQLRVAGWCPVD